MRVCEEKREEKRTRLATFTKTRTLKAAPLSLRVLALCAGTALRRCLSCTGADLPSSQPCAVSCDCRQTAGASRTILTAAEQESAMNQQAKKSREPGKEECGDLSLCLHLAHRSPAVAEENDIPLSWLPSKQDSEKTEHLCVL